MRSKDLSSLGEKSLDLWLQLTKEKGSLIRAFTGGKQQAAINHYPENDYISHSKLLQYFYHCHTDDEEHGHIHVYAIAPTHNTRQHLIGISLSNRGLPIGLFTLKPYIVNEQGVKAKALQEIFTRTFCDESKEDKLTSWLKLFTLFYQQKIFKLMEQGLNNSKLKEGNEDIAAACDIDWAHDLDHSQLDPLA